MPRGRRGWRQRVAPAIRAVGTDVMISTSISGSSMALPSGPVIGDFDVVVGVDGDAPSGRPLSHDADDFVDLRDGGDRRPAPNTSEARFRHARSMFPTLCTGAVMAVHIDALMGQRRGSPGPQSARANCRRSPEGVPSGQRTPQNSTASTTSMRSSVGSAQKSSSAMSAPKG